MTFPTIAATATSQEPDDTLTHTVSLPAGIQSGDLLIVIFSEDAIPTITFPNEGTDWIVLKDLNSGATGNRIKICYRNADGGEGASITVTTGTVQQSAHCAYRITGHSTSQAPECSTGATGATANPDPDSLTPTGGAKDYLWIALHGNDRNRTTSAYPTNYDLSQITIISDGSGGAGAAMCGRNLNASPEDPGTFTISASDQWCAATVAVHPTSGATYTKTFTADSILKATLTKPFTSDAILQATLIKAFTADAILALVGTKTFNADAILKGTLTKTFTIDALLKATQTKLFTVDAILTSATTKTFMVDAILKGTLTKTFNVDAILKATFTKTFSADAILISAGATYTKTFTADAILKGSIVKSFTVDAILQAVTLPEATYGGPVPTPRFPIYLMKLIRDVLESEVS